MQVRRGGRFIWAAAAVLALAAGPAFSGSPAPAPTIAYGDDWARFEFAPNWSDELGWSLRSALGTSVSDRLALGVLAEYGQNKQEYLANAGIGLADGLNFIATAGLLQENNDFGPDIGRQKVHQFEYGASLKGTLGLGILQGFELNGYMANAKAGGDVEAGRLYGAEFLANLDLTSATRLQVGAGREWLRWDEGAKDDATTLRITGTQSLTDNLSVSADVKFGASERLFGGGLAHDLDDGTGINQLGLRYSYIEGQHGVASDKRVELTWNFSLDNETANASSGQETTKRQSAEPLLSAVMQRPAFLPNRVLARAGSASCNFNLYATNYLLDDNVRLAWTEILPAGYTSYGDYGYNEVVIMYGSTTLYGRLEANVSQYAMVNPVRDGGFPAFLWSSFTGPLTLIVTLRTGEVCTGVFEHP